MKRARVVSIVMWHLGGLQLALKKYMLPVWVVGCGRGRGRLTQLFIRLFRDTLSASDTTSRCLPLGAASPNHGLHGIFSSICRAPPVSDIQWRLQSAMQVHGAS